MNTDLKSLPVVLRMSAQQRDQLWKILFKRYPRAEWGTFIRLGWHESSYGLVLTLAGIDEPQKGDLNEKNWMTEINSQYLRRVVRQTENHPFAVGFVHSHPLGYETNPSELDDDMEQYISGLLLGYNKHPFVSLIFSNDGNTISASGRVYWKGGCYNVSRFAIEGCSPANYTFKKPTFLSESALKRIARLSSAFSEEAANSLAGATVGIVGLGGTGSPVVELLARAGVGRLVLVDGDTFADSNLERVHGSGFSDIENAIPKCLLADRHVMSINPDCKVTVIEGKLPQQEVVDALLWCDVVVGCTDLHSARIALTELSYRYLAPVFDVGVNMEGENGKITGQVLQINRLFPSDACVYCRDMIDSQIASQELMSPKEQQQRQQEASKAKAENRAPNAYWVDVPQLNTVGYLTTLAGSMTTGFVIGYLTGRFSMPKNRIECNLTSRGTQIVERDQNANLTCLCQTCIGNADQNPEAVLSSAPDHWAKAIIYKSDANIY